MFNLDKLEENRKKSVDIRHNSHFYKFINNDIVDRLEPIEKQFQNILIFKTDICKILESNIRTISSNSKITYASESDIHKLTDQFDLIMFPFGFHWISEVQNFLSQVKQLLKKDGLFICNFPGGGSLRNLRKKLIELEAFNGLPHTPHISPFIQFDQVTPLLQNSGFIENIIDMEPLELEYDTALDLMKQLKNHGEANILKSGISYSINKRMYRDLQQKPDSPFADTINLITFISSPQKNTIKLKDEYYLG